MAQMTKGAEIVSGADLARPGDDDLTDAFDAAYGMHPADARFALVELDPAELLGLGVELLLSGWWCDHCTEDAEDDDEAARLNAACIAERREPLDGYTLDIAAGSTLDPPVVELTAGGDWRIIDGYHRVGAARTAGVRALRCHLLLDD